jgi:hypothetical protein
MGAIGVEFPSRFELTSLSASEVCEAVDTDV